MSSAAFLLEMLGGVPQHHRGGVSAAGHRCGDQCVQRVCCAPGTTQDQIRQATGLKPGNLSKIVKRACEKGSIRIAASRGADGTKDLSPDCEEREALEDFESRCATACSDSGTTIEASGAATQARGKKSLRSQIAASRARTLNFFEDQVPNEIKTLGRGGAGRAGTTDG